MANNHLHLVVTGAAGRLGSMMAMDLRAAGHQVTAVSHADLDISDAAAVMTLMDRLRPDVIVNCSAYNAVDSAESNPATAFAVNAHGPAALASAATRLDALLVHYSTDFVFDGNASRPYREDASTNPLNVYGASKLAGEQEAARTKRHYILRVESLFGGSGASSQKATVDFIADSLLAGGTVRAIVDRTVSPSYVPDVVRVTKGLLREKEPFGIYHCVTTGSTNWFELASEIASQCGGSGKVLPVMAEQFPTVAPRPRFCALSNERLINLGYAMPTWRGALSYHLSDRRVPARVAPALRARIA